MGCTPSSLTNEANTDHKIAGFPRAWKVRKEKPEEVEDAVPPVICKALANPRSSQDLRFSYLTKEQLQHTLKVLVVSPKEDACVEALSAAAGRLGYDSQTLKSADAALGAVQGSHLDLIIVDARFPRLLDAEALCRNLRSQKCCQFTVIVALVKKGIAEKDDMAVVQYLNAGFNRWLVESSSACALGSELAQVEAGDVAPRAQAAAALTLFSAVERSRDPVHVTDAHHNIQYVNRAGERFLGYSLKDVAGKNILELSHVDNRERLQQQLSRGRDWEGGIVWARKGGDTVHMHCRVVPSTHCGRLPSHYVFLHELPTTSYTKRGSDTSSVLKDIYQPARGSLHSVRRNSYDIRSVSSDGIRRQSIAKLHNLSIEAPITKIITLITMAQDSSAPDVVQCLDKVIDILRSTELYSPAMKEDRIRSGDAVTSDLIGALLQGNVTPVSTTRRSSNDSQASRTPSATGGFRFRPGKMSNQLRELLEGALLWEFDIFKLEELTAKRPLVNVGMNLMLHFDVPGALGCDEATLHNWLTIIELNYHSNNTYHNSTHAADVLQACANFLERERLKQLLDNLDEATCLIAAAAHDVDHPGKNSAFLCNSFHDLAILYNDVSVLESHHAALTFKLTMSDDRVNILKGLERDVFKRARQNIIDMILATDMTKHFENVAKFVNVFAKPVPGEESSLEVGSDSAEGFFMPSPENVGLVKRMLIKCADVSNPARPLKMCVEWARRIAEEYFNQTEEEKENNLPVLMPMFDRATCSIPKSQIGFMDFIINDMFEAWESFIEMPELMQYIENNYRFWKEKEAQGVVSIHEVQLLPSPSEIHEDVEAEMEHQP